ncbi:DUF2927 domain-containing protein [Frigidibacter sp. ROC022]|uniref:DUF2927 domain-containing protein n=1 Tax=Frigidibacter sp. ROC022 TaxID=2971796 RepID=UPI00215AAA1A|nr:DUF2927 domain-containing protein [Frigidibacter sp. ROC022]MCR8722880.1 DUF2927 domain-containing protein [Frigidibacter sp. ROC022]
MRGGWALLAAACLAACDAPMPVEPVPAPPARPARPATPEPSALSAETAAYYARIQAAFLAQGLMRTDPGDDLPFTTRDLVETFLRIAMYDEYTNQGGRLIERPSASTLRRWERPVQMRVVFGPAVDPASADRDRARISAFAARLARLTRHPISMVSSGGNFIVLILTEGERRAYGPELARLIPGLDRATTDAIINMDPQTYCLVVNGEVPGSMAYGKAVAVIRAENPDLLRLSCVHEELAQGLGLANDSPKARPSIFNDDEEFALLTRLDELLLRILYDPRLKVGMTEAEARPIVEVIAEELMGGPA